MAKQFYFFKKAVRNRLEDDTFWTLWELVESWTQNDWTAIFFIIFLGIIFEVILIKICASFNKKPALPAKGSSRAQEKEDSCRKSMKFDNCPVPSSSEERMDDFSEGTITSSVTSEENESNFEERVSTTDEIIWSSASESKYQISHFSESHVISSNGTSSSLSLFHSEVKEFFPSHGGYPENEHKTIQFSSRKLFSIMKANKNKNLIFSSDFNFSRSSRITIESEDLDVAPCPSAHLLLSRDQVRLLEENVRNQIALKSNAALENKTTYPYSRLQESLIQDQYSTRMDISAQPQDSFPGQNAPQNQDFYKARFTSQAQQIVINQESVNSQPDIMARYFALPQDLTRKPFSSSTQDSSQNQDMDRSQHLVNVSHSAETQDSIKGLESDKDFDEAQYSVWLKDSKKIKYLIQGQNAIFKNARFLVLALNPNSFAQGMLQIKKPGGQKQIASSELSQYSVYGSGPFSPILKRQKNRKKTLHSKSKLSFKVPSQKSKKTRTPWIFQMTVCHTSKPSQLGCKYNAKQKELHQRKGVSDMALHLTYVSKLIPPYVKKYSRKKLVKVMPGVTGCRHSLSSDAENVLYVVSLEKRRTSGRTKNIKQHGGENKGKKTISPKIPPQLEQSFTVNTFQLKSPHSSLIEMTWKNKASLKEPIIQAKELGIAEFHVPDSKKTSDLHISKQETSLKEALSEPLQKFVSSPEMEPNRTMKTQEDLKNTENSHLPLSNGEKLPTTSPEMKRHFPDRNIQKQKDFLEIVLETSEVNLLISLGIKEHKTNEQLASIKTQESTEDVTMKEKKPLLTLHVTGDNISESEGLEGNTRSNIKNTQGQRIFATFHKATTTTISEPPDMEMHSRLKAKMDTSTTRVSHSVLEPEKLPDEKKTWDAEYTEKRGVFKKPQEHDREEEEQTSQEAFPQLTQDFSLSLQLKQKPKYVRFEIKQSGSGSSKTQNTEQETLRTETVSDTSPMDPSQVEVKQSRRRPAGRGSEDPQNPLPVLKTSQAGEVLIETTECGVPFGGSPRKIPGDHGTEEKAALRVLPAAALRSFIIQMLPFSYFKRRRIRKRLSGAKGVLSPKSVNMKVKKPTNLLMLNIGRHGIASLRKILAGRFKILIKEMLQDKIVADVLVNVTYPHISILPQIRTQSRLTAEDLGQIKLEQEKSEDEREEKDSDSMNKGSDLSGNLLEEVRLQDEVKGDKDTPRPEAVFPEGWALRLGANPEKELKTKEEVPQQVTSTETLTESVYSPIIDLFHVENMKKSLTSQTDSKFAADPGMPLPKTETSLPTSETPLPTSETSLPTSETPLPTSETSLPTSETPLPTSETSLPTSETPLPTSETSLPTSETPLPTSEISLPTWETPLPTSETPLPTSETPNPTSEKSLAGDPSNQIRESDVLEDGGETRKVGYFSAELPKDLPATFPETFNCHMPIVTHSKTNKNKVRFSHMQGSMEPRSIYTKTMKPAASQVFKSTDERRKLDSKYKAKLEKINQANGLVYEFINTLYSPMQSFYCTRLKQGEFEEVRPRYVDFFDKSYAFHDQEEKVEDGEEVKQKNLLEAASQHTQYPWPDACQGEETRLDEPDSALDCLTRELPVSERDAQDQAWLAQTALHTGHQVGPREAEEREKISETENGTTAPMGPQIPPPKAENSSSDTRWNTMAEGGLPCGGNPERVLTSYFVENNSALPEDSPVTCLNSFDSVEPSVSRSERKKNTFDLVRKHITASHRHRTITGERPSVSHTRHGRQNKGLRCNFKTKMKNPQQNKNRTDAFLSVIQCNVPILRGRLHVETDIQRIARPDHVQPMQEKLLTGRKVCCLDYIVSTLTNSVRNDKGEEGKHKILSAPENSQVFVFDAYQKENCDLLISDEELKQPQSINTQVQPQVHGTQTILGSASCPILDQFQFGKLECYARFSHPKSGEAKMDEIIFSAREYGVPSEANHQKEQAGGIERKDTVTFDFSIPALSTFKRKKIFKKYSGTKTLVSLKCRILKAKKPPVSYIFGIKGGASPNHRRELRYDSTTNMGETDPGEKMAAKMYSFMNIIPDITTYRKTEREKGMLRERNLSSKRAEQAISVHEENMTSDDTRENSLHDAEEEGSEQETLKVIPQHSQNFKFCPGQKEELDFLQSENQGGGTEQDISQQMQPTDSMWGQKPKKSYQTQDGAMYTASSELPLLKSKKSLIDQFLMDTMKDGVVSVGNQMGELYSHDREENAECKKDLQANVLESSVVSTSDLSESIRQRKAFTSRALKNKMSPRCVIMKAKKTPISPIFNTSGNGRPRNLRPKTLKSQIIDLLIHIKCSGVLEDLIAERKEGLAQELLESLDLSTLALPASKRKRNNLKYIDKRNKMSLEWVTSKAKMAAISQMLTTTKRGTPSHGRRFKCNFKIMMKQGKPVRDMTLNAISSPVPALLDMKMHNRIKAESDVPGKLRFSYELQQQEQLAPGERACYADSGERRGHASNDRSKVKDQCEEAALWKSQHSSFIAGEMKEPYPVKSELELKSSARKKISEPLNTALELQQQTLVTQRVLQSVSCSILNSLPLKKQPKSTKTQKGLKSAKSPKILSPRLEKPIPKSLIVKTHSDIPAERGPRKELARSTPEEKIKLQKHLQARTLKCFDFSPLASSEFEGWRNAAQIPKSRNGILKTINIAKSGALSHGKEQDFILENTARKTSQSTSGIFVNTFPSPAPISPAIKTHNKVKKRDPLRNKSNIIQPEQHEGERLCPSSSNKWSDSSSTSESRWQNEKEREGDGVLFEAGLQFLYNTGRRKDQNMPIVEDMPQQTLVSETILESTCSPLIPFQTGERSKSIPPQEDIPHGIGQKIPFPISGKAAYDYFSTDETECSPIFDGSPARKPDVHVAVSLQPEEEEEDIKTQKVRKHRVDPNILPTKSGNSVLGDPGDKSSRRKMGSHIAKKHGAEQRDVLTTSTVSVLFDSGSQEKILKFSGRKNFRGPKCVTMREKKPLCSQMLNVTEHDHLYHGKEQGYNLKSTIHEMQQNKSIANAFLSPTPVSSDNKIDIEMHITSKAETDPPRVKLHSCTSAELGKSPRDGQMWKAKSTDPQNRPSNTMKMNVQHEKEAENIQKTLLESVPHYNQRFSLSAHHMQNPGSYQSESELNNLEVRSTWNLSYAAQKMRQEKCSRETILEPVSRHVMNFLQVETVKKSFHTQEGIKSMGALKTPFPRARKSEPGSKQGSVLWGGNARRKWDSSIVQKKAWDQNDLAKTALKSSDFSSLDSCEPKSQSYTFEFVGKKSMINPKHVTLKAKKPSVSQLLNITRFITGSYRKTGCKFRYKMKVRHWFDGVSEASLLAAEGTKIPAPKLVTDGHSFEAPARGTLHNGTLLRNQHGHITEEKADLWENPASTFLEPVDFLTPVSSDSESQMSTVQLLEEKITLNPRCLTLKEKEPAVSQLLKIRGQFTIKHRKKLASNLKTKVQQLSQGKNVADTFLNTIYFTPDTSDIERQNRSKVGMDRVSRFSHVQPTQGQLLVEGLLVSPPPDTPGHAALSINEQQEKKTDRKRKKTVLNMDLKFIYDSMPISSHIKMEQSPSTWGIYEDSSEKRNALNKASASSLYAYTPMFPKIIKHKAKAKTADVKSTMHTKWMRLKAKKPPASQLFNPIGCGTRRNKKELRWGIKKQKEFQGVKTIADLFLNTVCDSGSLSSQIKQFTEAEREKDRPRKPIYLPPQLEPEESLNKRKMSSSKSAEIKNTVSRNIKTLKRCIRDQKEKCQIVSLGILPQCRGQLVISQQVKKESDHVKIGVALKREVFPGLAPQKREINYTSFDIPGIRTLTECEFLVVQRVQHKDADVAKHSVSIPWGRGVCKNTNVSLNSKGQKIFPTELDASQQKTHKEQEFWKEQGSISLTIQGSVAYPITELPPLKNTGKVAEEAVYSTKRTISHLLRREDTKETKSSQGSKGLMFLCANLGVQQTMSVVQKGVVKPDGIPESIVDSVSRPNKECLRVSQAINTKKEDVSTPISLHVNPWRLEQSKLMDSPLRLNGWKMTFPGKLRAKQLHSSNQNKENILESVSSCILDQLYNEKLKNISVKGVSSEVLSSVVNKASNEAHAPVEQPYINLHNRRRKEHQKESTCHVLPTSVSHSSMDVLQIKLPCIKKTLKAPAYHTANTEGTGLLTEGKGKHAECIQHSSPKSASYSLRGVFQSKIPCEKKASEEAVSTVDYIPSTEKISLFTGKESKAQTGKSKSATKLTTLCTSLPSLSHTNVNSRIKVGQDKSGIPRSCLPPLKLHVSPNVRKTSFSESVSRGSLSNGRESKHLPQEKKEDGKKVVCVKDTRGLKCVTFKGEKTPFKHTLHGKETQWNIKEQEEMMQKEESDLDIVQSKHHASIPSSPHVEWDPDIKEVLMRGITGFCLPSLTLQELSDAMELCEEPADDILSSIKKAKYMPRKDREEMALEEIRHPRKIALQAKESPINQDLQLDIKEKEKKMQEDKHAGTWSKSFVSISFPPYSGVDIIIKGQEALLIKTRSFLLQAKLQESSDTRKIAYKQSIYGDTSNTVKEAKEHYIVQEGEERVKMIKIILWRKKKSPIVQEIQLDTKGQVEKIQKIKDEPNVLVTNASTHVPAPSHLQLDTKIKKADYVTEVTRYSLPELSQPKSPDAVKKVSKKSPDGDIASDVQEAQKEETNVEKAAKRDTRHPTDEDLKSKQALLQDIPLTLREPVKEDPEGEEQGIGDGGEECEPEGVLPTRWASESSLTHHESNTRVGEEDMRGMTRCAVPQLQLQKSSDAGERVNTKSAGDDISNDVGVVQEGEDRRKIVNVKYIMYPKGTTSKAKVFSVLHVFCSSEGCEPRIGEVQTSLKEKLRYIQERSELDKVLTRPPLPQLKLNKGIEGKEKKPVTRPFLLPSWQRESSNAEKLKYAILPLSDISNESKRTKYMTQREEDKVNSFEKDIMHSKYITSRAKKSPLSLILKTKELQVNIKEQVKEGQEDNKETVVLLSKIHPFLTSSSHRKWDTIKEEEGESGTVRNDVPHLELQESLPSGQMASKESSDHHVKRGDHHPQQAERDGVQTEGVNGSVQAQDTDFKAKTSPSPHTFSVPEIHALNKRKEPQWRMKEKGEGEQQRMGDTDVAPTKTSPSTPSPSCHRLDTRPKADKGLRAITGFSPSQLLCPKSSGAGKTRYADSNESIRSCNVIIKAYQCMPKTDVKDTVKMEGGKGRRFPEIITSTAETSPLPHLPCRKRLPLNIKDQGKEAPEGKGELEMVLKKTYASLPSPSYVKWNTRMNEKKHTAGIIQSYFPPPKIQDPSSSGKKPYTKSFDVCVLKGEGRLKTDIENKMAPVPESLRVKELPCSPVLDTKRLQGKFKKQEREVQKDENDLAMHLENICTSLLTLPYLKFGSREGEGYMIRITKLPLPHLQSKESSDGVKTAYAETTDGELSNDVKNFKKHTLQEEMKDREKNMDMNSTVDPKKYFKAKKSPNLLRYNLNNLQWKTKKQERTAQEGQREPRGAMRKETCTCRSPLLHFNTNTCVGEKRMPILTRSSFSTVSSQESSDSEDTEYTEPISSDILISRRKGKHRMPQNKEKGGVETVNLTFPKYQEKKVQESKDESSVVVSNSSPLPSLPGQQLDKEVQVGEEMLGPTRSAAQRESNAGEVVPTEAIHGDVIKDSQKEKQLVPQEEEQDREKTTDVRNMTNVTDIILRSRKSPPSLVLHRTELHVNIGGQEQKRHECPGKPPSTVLRKIYVSKPPAKLTLDKGIQVEEKRLRIKRPSLIPQMPSAVSGTKMRGATRAICDVRERKQHKSRKEKKHEVKTVDMRIRMHDKEARISSISHIFDTKEFVLNIKELKENVYQGKDELPVVLTRTFLSVPPASPLSLDSGIKTDRDVAGLTGSTPPQRNLQESSDTQKRAIPEVAAGDGDIIRKAEHSVPQEEAGQQWALNFVISVQRKDEPPRVKSEGDLNQLVLNSQHEDVYLTGFGTIRGKRLEYFFTGPEVHPEKYKTETFTTFLSYPTVEPTKIGSLKKQTEIRDRLNHKMSPKVLVSPPRKISKEIYITFGAPISTKGFSVSEQDAQQKTLSKASSGSADSYIFDKPEKEVHNNDQGSKMLSPKVSAPQTKGSLEKMIVTESDPSSGTEEQEIVVNKQVVLQSESRHTAWLDSGFSPKFPLQHGRQQTPLETDIHKQTTVYPRIQILPGIHMDVTVFDTIRGKKEQGLPVPEQEECILESLQKSLSSHWAFPLQAGDLEGKNKTGASTTIKLEQKTLEVEEGELKIDTNIVIRLAVDKTERHKHATVKLGENTKRDPSDTVNLNIPSLKAQKSQTDTQLRTQIANSCPIRQKHKKELEVSGAKPNIQPQKLFQKHVLDSFYAYIPLSLKFKAWKGRLTADLKRESSPKSLTMKIPSHPVSQILNNTGRGTPSNRKKLEYDLKKPKKIVWRSQDASGIFIRSLSISAMSSSLTEEIVDCETNLGREKILCLSEFRQKSPNTQGNSSSTVKEGAQHFTNTVPEDSQPFVVDGQQRQQVPSVETEANLCGETKEKILIPQTKEERVVPGHDNSRIVKECDFLRTEERKAPKPVLSPTEHPLMSDDPKDSVQGHTESTLSLSTSRPRLEEPQHGTQLFHTVECSPAPQQGGQSKPIQDTDAQNVQQQNTFPGTGPITSQVKSNEIKVVADSTSAESLLPLFEAIKSIFESQIKNMVHDNIREDILRKVKAPAPDDWKAPPCAGSPATTSMVTPPKAQPKPILGRFSSKENNKLTNHFESKVSEIKLNLIPEMAKLSFQKFDFYLKRSIPKDYSWRLYPRHKNTCFLSLEGIDAIELNLKHTHAKDSAPVSFMKTLIVSVSSDGKEIITKLKSLRKLESRASSVTSAKQMLLPHILQNYSVEEEDKLLLHFAMKTLEIQMKAFPRIVRESYAMASPQNIRKPLSKCIHSGFKAPRRKNRILLLFEEKSLHQIDLDLQYKYLRFLLGLPVRSIFPKPTALPKHIKLNTVAICENIGNRGESDGGPCIDMELLEQHISFKKQSPHENSSLRKFLEPTLVCASEPNQQGSVKKDTTALSKLKSPTTLDKDKQCHVWFQEIDTCKSFDSKTQKSTPSLADSHSTQISEDFTESHTNIESSDNLEECSALGAHESEEYTFLKANPYLGQESQNILFKLQKGLPLENLYKMKKSKTNWKPLYREDSGSQYIRGCRKHSSAVTHSYDSHKSRKYRSSSKTPSPEWLRHHPLNTAEVPSRSPSIPVSEERSSWTVKCRTNHSSAPLTESNIKLHLAKDQGKPHRHLESKEGKKANFDLFRKNNILWDCDYSHTQNKEKGTRRKKVHNYEAERSNYFPSKPRLPSKLPQEDFNFHSERKHHQPFFYACIPADSLEIIPQTIRWTIPPRTLRKTNFRVPLVAKISSSFNIWTSSKKFLESLLESFNSVHPN